MSNENITETVKQSSGTGNVGGVKDHLKSYPQDLRNTEMCICPNCGLKITDIVGKLWLPKICPQCESQMMKD